MRADTFRCEWDVTAVRTLCFGLFRTLKNKMAQLKELKCCPDGYRALNSTELTELLHNDDKMDQIIRLNEKVRRYRRSVFP